VRAWELDNEPEMYRTHWQGQAADYAEFVTLAAARIKAEDPQAIIVAPGLASGRDGLLWLEAALNAAARSGSPAFRAQAKAYSLGPVIDVVSLHNYEGLDSAFTGGARTIAQVFDDVRAVFEKGERQAPGFTYSRKQDYWHTEGNFDFVGVLSAERRAAWRMQFFTRAFAAGLRKVCVMDASDREQTAVRAYVRALPWPFPMKPADAEVKVLRGRVAAFQHADSETPGAGRVWVLWAVANTGPAQVEIPVWRERVTLVQVDGSQSVTTVSAHRLLLDLKGDSKMAPPVLLIDRPVEAGQAAAP
jgi:DNA-nicking Smr family endonuclease